MIDELEDRADAGEAAAACRLAAEVAMCSEVRGLDPEGLRRQTDQMLGMLEPTEENDRFADMVVARSRRTLQSLTRCQGIDEQVLHSQARYDLRAARLGDLEAARRFVSGKGMDVGDLLRDPELGRLYEQHGWGLFLQLLHAGDPGASWLWARAAGDHQARTLLSAVLPPDWQRQDVAQALFERVMDEAGMNPSDGPVSPPVDPAAVTAAATLFDRYFSQSRRFHERKHTAFRGPAEDMRDQCAELGGP